MDNEEQISGSQRDLEHAFVSRDRGIVHWVVDHVTKEMGHKQRDIWAPQWHLYYNHVNDTARKERKFVKAEAATSCSVADPLTVGGQKEVESRREKLDWNQSGLNRNGQEPANK